ncbi:MAG: M48 family metalloprotease [Parvibaculaceae bacterium]|nr:M48 family metalloprotease [Parvibaculaceae bacterium]
MHRKILNGCLAFTFLLSTLVAQTSAASAMSLIRDAETEHVLRTFAEPVFEAAGLQPKAVRLHIINDNRINAFVAGGQRMFIHTGLIYESETPGMLIGVMAHETGHIAGGHLSRIQNEAKGATAPMIISLLLGVGAIIAGAGDVGAAVIAGGQTVAQRSILQYSRVQEAAADQAAITYLDRLGWSGKGMLRTFEIFRDQELLSGRYQDPYLRSHPLSSDRLAALEDRVGKSPYTEKKDPEEWVIALDMVKAKLHGFIDQPAATYRRFPESDQSAPARYARTVAYHKEGRLKEALVEVDSLIAELPGSPFLRELKGQVLFESGKAAQSLKPYREAVALAPTSGLLHLALAQAMIEVGDDSLLTDAVGHLNYARRYESDYPLIYHQMALAHARLGNEGLASLATAERFYLSGALPDARVHAKRAQQYLPEGSPTWLRAEDILQTKRPSRG